MNKLLWRSLLVGLVAVASLAGVSLVTLGLGWRGIVKEAEDRSNRLLASAMADTLGQAVDAGEVDGPRMTARLDPLLATLPVRLDYVMVVDSQGGILYLNHLGSRPVGQGRNLADRLLEQASWQTIQRQGRVLVRWTARTLAFDDDQTNLLVLEALGRTAFWGIAAALLLALSLAYLLARSLSRQASALVEFLRGIEAGRLDLPPPVGGIQELGSIAASALALQVGLAREQTLRRQWAADVAHDLRTPLAVLKGQLEGMIDGVLIPDRQRLEQSHAEVLRLEHLVSQLAELTRLESPDFRPSREGLDPGGLLEDLARRFSDQAGRRQMSLKLECPAKPVRMEVDRGLLDRALGNLLDNALAYGTPDSQVVLGVASQGGGRVRLWVDNAGLLPPEAARKVFDRLYRAGNSRQTPGSGLGLSIVQAIARAHGGSSGLDLDQRGGRTVFWVDLPAQAPGS